MLLPQIPPSSRPRFPDIDLRFRPNSAILAGVKVKDLPRALGWHGQPREYPHEVVSFELPAEGEVHLARWQHPGETPKVLTQQSVDALRAFLREGDVAVDIGAHTGDSTLPIALAVGPRGRVFALEPNPYVFKVLAANAALNPAKARVTPLMFAAMPADGRFEFEYSDNGYCNGGFHDRIASWKHGHFHRLTVDGRNLSAYLREHAAEDVPRLRYIKIDTEGFDRAVVSSIADLIASARPYLKTEIYKHLPNAERDAYELDLRRLGYRLFACGEAEYRGEELGPGALRRWRHFDVFAVPQHECAPPPA
jgi:FkbM family methyltransferase